MERKLKIVKENLQMKVLVIGLHLILGHKVMDIMMDLMMKLVLLEITMKNEINIIYFIVKPF